MDFEDEADGNRRAAPRMRLVYRTAKLLFDDHEILIVVRNVSQTGLNIQTFGAIDLPARMQVELPSGLVFPITQKWQKETNCGASFDTPIDVGDFLTAETPGRSRRPLRANIECGAILRDGSRRHVVTVKNIGSGGAMFEGDFAIGVGTTVKLTVEGLDIHEGEIRWVGKDRAGMQFSSPLPFAKLAEWTTERVCDRMSAGPRLKGIEHG